MPENDIRTVIDDGFRRIEKRLDAIDRDLLTLARGQELLHRRFDGLDRDVQRLYEVVAGHRGA